MASTGTTTLLNVLAAAVPAQERVVTIEESSGG
jgi:Flp pilus assembly CpaF family ATPase